MPLSVGTHLGPYEILAPLGAGGMGEVYRARDTRLRREVAVKVLPEALASDPEAIARFEREALAVASLSHPNILAIYDVGNQGAVTYAVAELLEGETLRGTLESGPVSQPKALDYALQIAKGMSAAHEKGVVHRDLKPENLFVTKDGHVKILDFGLAKRVEAVPQGGETSAPTGSGHTEPGAVLGTMGYMSPEQLRGLPLDHRSDIFSFGAVLYELLSGQKAFKRRTASDTIVAILTQEPAELTGSDRNILPTLDHVVRHCLEKEAGSRFQSAKDIVFALSEALLSTPAMAGSQAVREPGPAVGKRRLIVAAAVVLTAVVGVLAVRQARRGLNAAHGGVKRVAVLPFENLGTPEEEYFTDGISDEIRGKLTSLPGVQVIARGSSTPYKKTTKDLKDVASELHVSYLLTATVRWEKRADAVHVQVSPELVEVTQSDTPTSKWQQGFEASLTDVFQVQSDIASRVARELGVALGAGEERQLAEPPTKSFPAYDAFLKGEQAADALSKGDPPSIRRALGLYEQAVALDPGFGQAWARISMANSLLYANSTPSPETAERARQASEKAMTLAPKDPESYRATGQYRSFVLSDSLGELEQYARGLAIAPGNANLMRNVGTVEVTLGHWDAALEHFRGAQRLDPRSVLVHYHLGRALLYLRRYREARQEFDACLALSPNSLTWIESRAMTFLGEGDLTGARAYLASPRKAVEPARLVAFLANYTDLGWVLTDPQRDLLLGLTPAEFDDDRGTWALCLSQVLWWRRDVDRARGYADEWRKAYEEQLRVAPDDSQRHALLGLALAYLGRAGEAIREGQRGVDLLPVSKDAINAPYNLHQLARIYTLVGQPERALDVLERLLRIPYYVSDRWIAIDPNFDPLRNNPRFRRLVAGAR